MKKIVFIDYKHTEPYSVRDLDYGVLNGTAGSVVNIAEKLGELYQVFVLHANQKEVISGKSQVVYGPLELIKKLSDCETVVTVRLSSVSHHSLSLFPRARHLFWHHNLPFADNIIPLRRINKRGATVIVVSHYHKQEMERVFREYKLSVENIDLKVIYDPISDDLAPDSTPVDRYKLFFCSNPLKGLLNALDCFDLLRRLDKRFRLYIASPSRHIRGGISGDMTNIHSLGHLSHQETIAHLRSSLSLFYPNFCYPETFGLVFAEALAVGTPVLTHDLGAASEVLNNPRLLVDTMKSRTVAEKIIEWSEGGRPAVAVNEAFRLSNVARQWIDLLG